MDNMKFLNLTKKEMKAELIMTCYEELREKVADGEMPDVEDLLQEELNAISQNDWCMLFYIAAYMVKECRSQKRPVTVHGMAAGGLTAYLLGLTEINPLAYGKESYGGGIDGKLPGTVLAFTASLDAGQVMVAALEKLAGKERVICQPYTLDGKKKTAVVCLPRDYDAEKLAILRSKPIAAEKGLEKRNLMEEYMKEEKDGFLFDITIDEELDLLQFVWELSKKSPEDIKIPIKEIMLMCGAGRKAGTGCTDEKIAESQQTFTEEKVGLTHLLVTGEAVDALSRLRITWYRMHCPDKYEKGCKLQLMNKFDEERHLREFD